MQYLVLEKIDEAELIDILTRLDGEVRNRRGRERIATVRRFGEQYLDRRGVRLSLFEVASLAARRFEHNIPAAYSVIDHSPIECSTLLYAVDHVTRKTPMAPSRKRGENCCGWLLKLVHGTDRNPLFRISELQSEICPSRAFSKSTLDILMCYARVGLGTLNEVGRTWWSDALNMTKDCLHPEDAVGHVEALRRIIRDGEDIPRTGKALAANALRILERR